MNLRHAIVASVVAGSFAAAAPASAQCGYGYGYWDIGRLYSVLADNVPYYAAFPPVYYSRPVPRTYGYSPFAYPPGVMTPEVAAVTPAVIENPYFESVPEVEDASAGAEPPAPAAVDRTTSVSPETSPLVIINPYVQGPSLASRAKPRG